ncbi:MAG: hypothetical protein CMB34_04575 [Euryarchaeota archaeon]|nr:hypothetical protein [Euryarchaeota archaeon]|tara:strand:- start:1131 stop:2480 length:1350 start_codon:yes stop_codon:yes gene_type:complete
MIDYDSDDVMDGDHQAHEHESHTPTQRDGFYQRENRRLRNSAPFRLGVLLTNAVQRPWRIIFLPFTVPYLVFCIGMERIGKRPIPYGDGEHEEAHQPRKDSIVLFPTNGVGFGHFTRMYALAKRWKKRFPSSEVVFFTTMPTLHLLYNDGFPTYHLAGRKKHKNMTTSEWNAMVEEQLSLVFTQHRPTMFVYDGAFPYRGMLNALNGQRSLKKVWLRRGMFKKGSNIPVDSIEHFDLIVRPEDSVPLKPTEIGHSVKTISVPPMVLLDHGELIQRNDARKRLGLGLEERVVYVQLGAGQINEIGSEVRLTIDALLAHENVSVVLGESMLGERLSVNLDRVVLLRDYPNSVYFNAFDASVQAGGYNSYHEMRKFGIPTVFYPNMATGMDDQLARCRQAEAEGWGLVVRERTKSAIETAVAELLSRPRNPVSEQENGASILQVVLSEWVDT